jgi:hypothetical protein
MFAGATAFGGDDAITIGSEGITMDGEEEEVTTLWLGCVPAGPACSAAGIVADTGVAIRLVGSECFASPLLAGAFATGLARGGVVGGAD